MEKDLSHLSLDAKKNSFKCSGCGDSREIQFPVPLGDFGNQIKDFIRRHEGCAEKGKK